MKILNIFAVAILIASTTCVKLPHAEGNMRNIELIEEDLMEALKNNNSALIHVGEKIDYMALCRTCFFKKNE